jgi:DNA-binding response OmpR family regulator
MRQHTILVVDDEATILRIVRATLEAAGYAVLAAERGGQALETLNDQRPALVLLDLMMPGMDGFETLRRIREESQVPVILLTARAGDMDRLRGLRSGADDYLTKPFNPDELVARVRAVLRRPPGLPQEVAIQPCAILASKSTWSDGASSYSTMRHA